MKSLEAYKWCSNIVDNHNYAHSLGYRTPEDEYEINKFMIGIFKELTDHSCETVEDLHKVFSNQELIIRLLGKWIEQLKQDGSNSKGMVLNDMIFYLEVLTGE